MQNRIEGEKEEIPKESSPEPISFVASNKGEARL